jgi:hypothetical protein
MVLSDSGRSSPVSVSRNSARIALLARSIVTASLMEYSRLSFFRVVSISAAEISLASSRVKALCPASERRLRGAMTATLILRARVRGTSPAPGTRRRK